MRSTLAPEAYNTIAVDQRFDVWRQSQLIASTDGDREILHCIGDFVEKLIVNSGIERSKMYRQNASFLNYEDEDCL
jgi:hypothetical protein